MTNYEITLPDGTTVSGTTIYQTIEKARRVREKNYTIGFTPESVTHIPVESPQK